MPGSLLAFVLKQLPVLAVAFVLQVVERNEAQGSRVDTIPQPARVPRSVVEDMTQVAVSMGRAYLCAGHAVAGILSLLNILGFQGFCETRPPATALELIER